MWNCEPQIGKATAIWVEKGGCCLFALMTNPMRTMSIMFQRPPTDDPQKLALQAVLTSIEIGCVSSLRWQDLYPGRNQNWFQTVPDQIELDFSFLAECVPTRMQRSFSLLVLVRNLFGVNSTMNMEGGLMSTPAYLYLFTFQSLPHYPDKNLLSESSWCSTNRPKNSTKTTNDLMFPDLTNHGKEVSGWRKSQRSPPTSKTLIRQLLTYSLVQSVSWSRNCKLGWESTNEICVDWQSSACKLKIDGSANL